MAGEVGTNTNLSPAGASLLGLSLAKIPKIVATFVSASSQGQRTHAAQTNLVNKVFSSHITGSVIFLKQVCMGARFLKIGLSEVRATSRANLGRPLF